MSAAALPTVEIGEAVLYQTLEDEIVLLNMTSQQYYGLDDVGATMWNLLLEHHEPETVVAKLKEIYDADETTLRQDLSALIQTLVEADLLKRSAPNAE